MKNPARRKFMIDSALTSGGLALGLHLPLAFSAGKSAAVEAPLLAQQ